MKTALTTLLCVGILIFSQPSSAEEETDLGNLSFEELVKVEVKSATFFDTDVKRAPGNVFVFDSLSLETLPVMRVGNIIDLVPGYIINTHQFQGDIIAVRGISTDNSAKTFVLLDGVSTNQRLHFGYQQSLKSPLFADIKQIEVIKGPGATLYGSGAINGFISMQRFDYKDVKGGKASYTYGLMDQLNRVEAQKGVEFGDQHGLYLYGGFAKSNGVAINGPIYGQPTDSNVHALAIPAPDYKISAKYVNHAFSLDNYFERTTYSVGNTALFASDSALFGPDGFGYVDKLIVNPKLTLRVDPKQSFEFSAPIEYMDFGAATRGSSAIPTPASPTNKGAAENSAGVKVIYRFEKLAETQNLAVGTSFTARNFEAAKNYFSGIDLHGTDNWQGMNGSWKEFALFAEDFIQVSKKLSIIAGLRFDKQVNGDFTSNYLSEIGFTGSIKPANTSSVTGRLAASYLANEQSTFKLSYQRGFRAPDANYYLHIGHFNQLLAQLGYSERMQQIQNEIMDSFELTYLFDFESKKSSLETSLYYNRYSNLIHYHDYTIDSLGMPTAAVNAVVAASGFMGQQANAPGTFGSVGFETIFRFKASEFMSSSGYLSYAFSRPTGVNSNINTYTGLTSSDHQTWALFPEHSIKGDYRISPTGKLTFDTTAIAYFGVKKLDSQSSDQTNYFDHPRVLVSINSIYQLLPSLSVNVLVSNVLNDKNPSPGENSAPANHAVDNDVGTTVYAGLDYHF